MALQKNNVILEESLAVLTKVGGESESKICNSYHTGTLLGNGNIGALVDILMGFSIVIR